MYQTSPRVFTSPRPAYVDVPQLEAELGCEAAERKLREVVLGELSASRVNRAR